MAGARTVSRILTISGILMMVVGGVGFIVVMILNAFVLDEFDAYGEVPIPGSGQVQLPAGQAQISFHTSVTGSPSSGFPMPATQAEHHSAGRCRRSGADRKPRHANDYQQ